MNKPSYRMQQTQRGNEALEMLAKFLESKNGLLTVSIHESHYSSGIHSQPGIVFGVYGIEVKRVEMFVKNHYEKNGTQYCDGQLGQLYLSHDSWDKLKRWCAQNVKIPMLVAVLTHGRQPPIFVKLSQPQVDEMQMAQKKKIGININIVKLLLTGEIWK